MPYPKFYEGLALTKDIVKPMLTKKMSFCRKVLDPANFAKSFFVTDLRGQNGGAYRNEKPLTGTRKKNYFANIYKLLVKLVINNV